MSRFCSRLIFSNVFNYSKLRTLNPIQIFRVYNGRTMLFLVNKGCPRTECTVSLELRWNSLRRDLRAPINFRAFYFSPYLSFYLYLSALESTNSWTCAVDRYQCGMHGTRADLIMNFFPLPWYRKTHRKNVYRSPRGPLEPFPVECATNDTGFD